MSAIFPPAPSLLPSTMPSLLAELARVWAENPGRPCPALNVLQHWDQLIDTWARNVAFPLYVRKANDNRGSIILHRSGRSLIPCDNSTAQWAFTNAILGTMPTLEEIHSFINQDSIPVAMIMKTSEKKKAKYHCTLRGSINPNAAGWKVCHIQGVGLATRTPIAEIDESVLLKHFHKLMTPRNMFVIPLKYAGLGELPEFCEAIGRRLTAVYL